MADPLRLVPAQPKLGPTDDRPGATVYAVLYRDAVLETIVPMGVVDAAGEASADIPPSVAAGFLTVTVHRQLGASPDPKPSGSDPYVAAGNLTWEGSEEEPEPGGTVVYTPVLTFTTLGAPARWASSAARVGPDPYQSTAQV